MNIDLPHPKGVEFAWFSVCGRYCADDPARFGLPIKDQRFAWHDKTRKGGAWLAMEPTKDGHHGHVHLDIGPIEEFGWAERMLPHKKASRTALNQLLEKLTGLPVEARVTAAFVVPVDLVPKRGIATTLLGLRTKAARRQLSLYDVGMRIRDELYRSVRYRTAGEGMYEVQLKLQTTLEIDENYISHFAELALEGLGLFVFEKKGDAGNAGDMPKRSKKANGA